MSMTTPTIPYTSAVLRITYEGALFHGWSAGNDGSAISNNSGNNEVIRLNKRSRSRRNRNRPSIKKGEVRSVQGNIRFALAKLYGDVDVDRIIVEGSSRTDAGVSARHMIALIYCLRDNDDDDHRSEEARDEARDEEGDGKGVGSGNNYKGTLAIQGKKLPHPTSPTDEDFMPLPFQSDIRKIIYTLNKMLPPDVRIADASTMPTMNFDATEEDSGDIEDVDDKGNNHDNGKDRRISLPFHPSLDTVSKTYSYTFSIGELYDPLQYRNVWHVPNSKSFNISHARGCASILCGKHDFIGFRGAFRGNERGKTQSTICHLSNIIIEHNDSTIDEFRKSFPLCDTYKVTITGNRFLYKMVRFLVGMIVQYGIHDDRSLEDVRDALSCGSTTSNLDTNDITNESDTTSLPSSSSYPRLCAPANGLVLEDIDFGDKLIFNWIIASSLSWS